MKLEGDWLHLNPLLLQMIQRVSRRIRDHNFPELILTISLPRETLIL